MQRSDQPISLVIFEDDDAYGSSIASVLDGTGVELIGLYTTPIECLQAVKERQPRVALIDLYYRRQLVGVELTRKIIEVSPRTACIVLTALDPRGDLLVEAYAAGAVGYQRKGSMAVTHVPDLIIRAAQGHYVFDKQLAQAISERFESLKEFESPRRAPLSAREKEVLRLVSLGMETKGIAQTLVIAESTVKTHIKSILNKLKMNDRHQAAAYTVMKDSVDGSRP